MAATALAAGPSTPMLRCPVIPTASTGCGRGSTDSPVDALSLVMVAPGAVPAIQPAPRYKLAASPVIDDIAGHHQLDLLPIKQFHAITMFEVLEHLDHPSRVLAQLSSHLIDGGILILETPDCSGVTDIKSHYDFRKIDPLEHINAFVHDTLKSIAERQGFRHIERGPGSEILSARLANSRRILISLSNTMRRCCALCIR